MGLSYVRARWLDSTTGSWLSVDPVESEPRYRYAYNAPTYVIDLTGRSGDYFNLDPTSLLGILPGQFSHLFHQLSSKFRHNAGIVQKALVQIAGVFQQINTVYEQGRRQLPPTIANLAPPSPFDIIGSLEYAGGLIWGALKAVFGMIPVVGLIPDIIGFIQYFIAEIAHHNFFEVIANYFREQWEGIVQLFTKVQNLNPGQRGEILGGMLVSAIVTVVGIIVTAGAALPLLLEGGIQDLFSNAKQLAREGIAAAKLAAKAKVGNVIEAAQAIRNKQLPPGLQRHIISLQEKFGNGINAQSLRAEAVRHVQELLGDFIGEGDFEKLGIRRRSPDPDGNFIYQGPNEGTCSVASTAMVVQHYNRYTGQKKNELYLETGRNMGILDENGVELPSLPRNPNPNIQYRGVSDLDAIQRELSSQGVRSYTRHLPGPASNGLDSLKLATDGNHWAIVSVDRRIVTEKLSIFDKVLRKPAATRIEGHVVVVEYVKIKPNGEYVVFIRDPAIVGGYLEQDGVQFWARHARFNAQIIQTF